MHIAYELLLVGFITGGVTGLVLRYFIFRASCALVDADPSHLKSLLIVLFGLAISLGIGVPMGFFGLILIDPSESTFLYVVWNLIGLAVIWAILGAIYIPALPVSVAKGFLLSGYEIILGLLANALIVAVILVVCAAIQIATNSGPNAQHSVRPAPQADATAPAL